MDDKYNMVIYSPEQYPEYGLLLGRGSTQGLGFKGLGFRVEGS